MLQVTHCHKAWARWFVRCRLQVPHYHKAYRVSHTGASLLSYVKAILPNLEQPSKKSRKNSHQLETANKFASKLWLIIDITKLQSYGEKPLTIKADKQIKIPISSIMQVITLFSVSKHIYEYYKQHRNKYKVSVYCQRMHKVGQVRPIRLVPNQGDT